MTLEEWAVDRLAYMADKELGLLPNSEDCPTPLTVQSIPRE
jgi:hypothetical protein